MHSSGPVYSGKELSDFIFPVFLSSLKNLGDFLSSSYSSYRNSSSRGPSCFVGSSRRPGRGCKRSGEASLPGPSERPEGTCALEPQITRFKIAGGVW